MRGLSGCVWSSDLCLSKDECSFRCVSSGSMLVSSCRCWMFVSLVHPVMILRALFWTVCSLFSWVLEMTGAHMVHAYSSKGLVSIL